MHHQSTTFSILWAVCFAMLAVFTKLSAQTAIGGNTPDVSAMLDVQSTTKGVLFPRVANPAAITSPATGLMIFNTGNNCLQINLGIPGAPSWQSIKCGFVCGAYLASGEWKRFLCHNLGSANFSADPFTPSWEIIGGYWQWGIQAQAAPGPTGTNGSTPNNGIPGTWTPAGTTWNTTPAGVGSWTDSPNPMPNNPCPPGYRIPTKEEWQGIDNNTAQNPQSNAGSSWGSSPTSYSTGRFLGPSLFLPAAGLRSSSNGSLSDRGGYGYYWSSTEVLATNNASYLYLDETEFDVLTLPRTSGLSVRCIEE